MFTIHTASFTVLLLLTLKFSVSERFQPNWRSLDSRKLPIWYDDVKFGIFMHWGLYSVPSFGPSEWFWGHWLIYNNTDVINFMKDNYKPGFKYQDFAVDFTAQLFNATTFAKTVEKSGARYFVFTSKHHEGYAMWPSAESWSWNSFDTGPHIDIVGELEKAFRSTTPDVHFGLYFSFFDWFHPLYLQDKANKYWTNQYVKDVSTPQLHDIIQRYKPDIVWGDGNWEGASKYWNSTHFLAWLYNDSPIKEKVVTNDRFGNDTMCKHGDVYTCHDGFNPAKSYQIIPSTCSKKIIHIGMQNFSCGGNLLMDIGPTSDGRIIPIFEERLEEIGEWLKDNGQAVYGTKPWIYQNDTINPDVWYTSKVRNSAELDPRRIYNKQVMENTIVYAVVLKWPANNRLKLGAPRITSRIRISMLGYWGFIGPVMPLSPTEGGIEINLMGINWLRLPSFDAWTFKLEYLATDKHNPFEHGNKTIT